jgi:hypothetical protein
MLLYSRGMRRDGMSMLYRWMLQLRYALFQFIQPRRKTVED